MNVNNDLTAVVF